MTAMPFHAGILRGFLCCLFTMCTLPALTVDHTVEVIVYFDDARPPVMETYTMTPENGGWGLQHICYDSDGDWMLDTSIFFVSPEKAVVEPFFEHHRNKLPLYRKADFYDAYVNDAKFRLDGYGKPRVLVRPEFDNAEVPKIRALPAYKKVMSDLARTTLAAPPKVPHGTKVKD